MYFHLLNADLRQYSSSDIKSFVNLIQNHPSRTSKQSDFQGQDLLKESKIPDEVFKTISKDQYLIANYKFLNLSTQVADPSNLDHELKTIYRNSVELSKYTSTLDFLYRNIMKVNMDKPSLAFLPYIDNVYTNYLTITDVISDKRFSHLDKYDLKPLENGNLKIKSNII